MLEFQKLTELIFLKPVGFKYSALFQVCEQETFANERGISK